MKYIWILRLILYNTFGKNGWAGSVYEGAAFICLLGVFPIASISLFFSLLNIKYVYYLGFLFYFFDTYLSYDEDSQNKQFAFYSTKRKELSKEFARVRLFIVINLILLILSFLVHAIRLGDLKW